MSIHPNAPPKPSKPEINDPEEYLEALLKSEPRPRKKDAVEAVLRRFPWWNLWKPQWRPEGWSAKPGGKAGGGSSFRTGTQQEPHLHHRERDQRRERREQRHQEEPRRSHQQQTGSAKARKNGTDSLFRDGDQAILQWTRAATSYEEFRVEEHHTEADAIQILLGAMTALRQERDRAIDLVNLLAQERRELRLHMLAQSSVAQQTRPVYEPNPLYRKVGLDEKCPLFILHAAKRAYRKKLHPDAHPPERKAEAERRFKEAEAVFEEIERQRGFARSV